MRAGAAFLVLTMLLLFVILAVSFRQVEPAISSPLVRVSDTLQPAGVKDYSFTIPEDLYDSLIHVVVNAAAPDSDRLDISVDGNSRTDIQGDWWDILGSVTAGEHTLTAATSQDDVNQLTFTVEIYEIPAPPFTIAGTFPPYSMAYKSFVDLEFNVTTPGDYLVSATASAGNFAIYVVGYDEIDVSGQTERTLQLTEAQTYLVEVQSDILGTGEATVWSMSIRPTAATATSSTTSIVGESTSSTGSTVTSATSTVTSSSVSSTVTSNTAESSTLSETISSTSSTMTSEMMPTSSEQTTTLTRPSGCVIATAAYGSEMAPEVVYMRFVRDELIGSTATGKVLVAGFNGFYYSWSPLLAREIASSQVLRAVFRVLLLPLVWIVHAAALVFTTFAGTTGDSNLASVLAFLLAALVTMSVYIILPALAVTKLERRVRRLMTLGRKQPGASLRGGEEEET